MYFLSRMGPGELFFPALLLSLNFTLPHFNSAIILIRCKFDVHALKWITDPNTDHNFALICCLFDQQTH